MIFFFPFLELKVIVLVFLVHCALLVVKVTTEHQKCHNTPFFAHRAKKFSAGGRSPPQELEVGLRSGPYLLVFFIREMYHCFEEIQVRPEINTKYQFAVA